jgi:hypothetical protein
VTHQEPQTASAVSIDPSVFQEKFDELADELAPLFARRERGLPPALQTDTANGEECDEYPFRTTLEGAANPDWDFSVRAVNGKQNGSAGQTLMIYMRNHRILAWDATLPAEYNDRFYVQIVDW